MLIYDYKRKEQIQKWFDYIWNGFTMYVGAIKADIGYADIEELLDYIADRPELKTEFEVACRVGKIIRDKKKRKNK